MQQMSSKSVACACGGGGMFQPHPSNSNCGCNSFVTVSNLDGCETRHPSGSSHAGEVRSHWLWDSDFGASRDPTQPDPPPPSFQRLWGGGQP